MALKERLEVIQNDGSVPINEETTKFQIIVPILGDLGWDVYGSKGTDEVRFEHPAGGTKKGGQVDIALIGEYGRSVCFVEAKKPGVNLDDHVEQLLGYAFHDSVTICVLTNGLEWRLYLPREDGLPADRKFAHLWLREDPIEQIAGDLEKFLSRSAVMSGEAKQNAVKALKQRREESERLRRERDIARRLPDIWRKMLTEPDKGLVVRIQSRVHAELEFSPSVDQIAEFLAATIAPNSTGSNTKTDKPTRPNVKRTGKPRVGQRIMIGATLFGTYRSLGKAIELLDFVTVQLYERHGQDLLDKVARISVGAVQISSDPGDMNRCRETGVPGIFIYSNLGVERIKARSYEWLALFGYPGSDLQIHYSDSDLQIHEH